MFTMFVLSLVFPSFWEDMRKILSIRLAHAALENDLE